MQSVDWCIQFSRIPSLLFVSFQKAVLDVIRGICNLKVHHLPAQLAYEKLKVTPMSASGCDQYLRVVDTGGPHLEWASSDQADE